MPPDRHNSFVISFAIVVLIVTQTGRAMLHWLRSSQEFFTTRQMI
jgi:hypothetical protein